ncbi:MAG: hypothetical protein H8D46_03335 [FCB group bacterium]|nr:hypothetical protein [FCB group bacterium]
MLAVGWWMVPADRQGCLMLDACPPPIASCYCRCFLFIAIAYYHCPSPIVLIRLRPLDYAGRDGFG